MNCLFALGLCWKTARKNLAKFTKKHLQRILHCDFDEKEFISEQLSSWTYAERIQNPIKKSKMKPFSKMGF